MTSMASVSLQQKKLEQLKQQVFGKSDSTPYKINPKHLKEAAGSHREVRTITFESITLKSDLIRISVLSAAAIAIQLSLFFAYQNGLLKFL